VGSAQTETLMYVAAFGAESIYQKGRLYNTNPTVGMWTPKSLVAGKTFAVRY
jgi:hypothetical protein